MVTGVLNDSTNLGNKKTRPHRPQSLPPNKRPSTSRLMFKPQPGIYKTSNLSPMLNALTSSPPVFDGKPEISKTYSET